MGGGHKKKIQVAVRMGYLNPSQQKKRQTVRLLQSKVFWNAMDASTFRFFSLPALPRIPNLSYLINRPSLTKVIRGKCHHETRCISAFWLDKYFGQPLHLASQISWPDRQAYSEDLEKKMMKKYSKNHRITRLGSWIMDHVLAGWIVHRPCPQNTETFPYTNLQWDNTAKVIRIKMICCGKVWPSKSILCRHLTYFQLQLFSVCLSVRLSHTDSFNATKLWDVFSIWKTVQGKKICGFYVSGLLNHGLQNVFSRRFSACNHLEKINCIRTFPRLEKINVLQQFVPTLRWVAS